jgi:hypothetical protein
MTEIDSMKTPLICTLIAGLVFTAATPNVAHADKWYQSGWVIGSAGLLVGTVVGYELGRSSRDRHTRVYHHDYYYHSPRVTPVTHYYAPPPRNDVYVDETRVWPFYRRTRIYPIAPSGAVIERATSSAWAPGFAPGEQMVTGSGRQTDAPVNVSLGDNNQNINVTINQPGSDGQGRRVQYIQTRPVLNYEVDESVGRRSERMIDVPVENSSSAQAPAANAPEESAQQAAE